MTAEEAERQWIALYQRVCRLQRRYRLPPDILPPAWYRSPGHVQILSGMRAGRDPGAGMLPGADASGETDFIEFLVEDIARRRATEILLYAVPTTPGGRRQRRRIAGGRSWR
ncbi:MAG TPA: hypothetical protein VGC45_14980 [Gryllotalpicola sp.]